MKQRLLQWLPLIGLGISLGMLGWGIVAWRSQAALTSMRLDGTFFFVDSNRIRQVILQVANSDTLPATHWQALEDSLAALAGVRNAEVYRDALGRLVVVIEEHEPVARVITPRGQFYVSRKGVLFPTVRKRAAYVPAVLIYPRAGESVADVLPDLQKLLSALQEEELLWASMAHVVYQDGNWIVVSRLDRQRIIIGPVNNLEAKLRRWKRYYQYSQQWGLWGRYRTIDLRYSHQIIASKIPRQ